MSRADSEGLLIWLEATPAGHPVYLHYGWKTVESVSVRLQDFVGNPGEQSGWGTYRMSGCLRLPMLVEKEKEKGKEKETRREEIGIQEEEQRRADEAVGRKKREDDKWWNDEWDKLVSERKLKKEKERDRRDALRESRKGEDKAEASRRFSEKRSEKKMDREKEFQKEEADGECHSWRDIWERMGERRSESESRSGGKMIVGINFEDEEPMAVPEDLDSKPSDLSEEEYEAEFREMEGGVAGITVRNCW